MRAQEIWISSSQWEVVDNNALDGKKKNMALDFDLGDNFLQLFNMQASTGTDIEKIRM
jgi:hypothetical protein